jgi:hypothetical protein
VLGVGGGVVGVGDGFGVESTGFGFPGDATGAEISPIRTEGAGRTATRLVTRWIPAGFAGVTRSGGIRTTGGAGAGRTTRGVAAARTSFGELDSKAARQRYPEVTPAATRAQSRSASNEIRTRMSIGPMPDSIDADIDLVYATTRFFPSSLAR